MITYEPLWETMKNKNITKYYLVHKKGVSQQTISRLNKNLPITTTTLNDLCNILSCSVDEIIKHTPDYDV